MYIGYYWWMILPAIALAIYAQAKVKSNYNKYAKVKNMRGLTGAQVAESILRSNQIYDVQIKRGQGKLTDHYDPRSKTVVLSPHVYDADSISAASIAAHECGHVLQHASGYAPLAFRSFLAVPTQFASKASTFLILGGIIFASSTPWLLDLGIIAYLLITLFHVVTLPVEFNASSRAIRVMQDGQLVYDEDIRSTKKVLNAAALTYVAAMLSALLTTLRLIAIRNRR
jgi:hypothetical protein